MGHQAVAEGLAADAAQALVNRGGDLGRHPAVVAELLDDVAGFQRRTVRAAGFGLEACNRRLNRVEAAQSVGLRHSEAVYIICDKAKLCPRADTGVARFMLFGDHARRPPDHECPPRLLLVFGGRRRDADPVRNIGARVDRVRRRALRLHLVVGVPIGIHAL